MLPDNSAFGALPRFCRPLTPSDRFLRRAGDVAGYAFVPRAEAHGARRRQPRGNRAPSHHFCCRWVTARAMRGPARAPPPWHAPRLCHACLRLAISPAGHIHPWDNFGAACTRSSAPSPLPPVLLSSVRGGACSAFLSTFGVYIHVSAAAKKDAPTAAELSAIIESKIMDYGGKVELEEIGKVLAIGDGIAR